MSPHDLVWIATSVDEGSLQKPYSALPMMLRSLTRVVEQLLRAVEPTGTHHYR